MVYDVAIIGSGLAGSSLAAILARHGRSVLLLEASSHPRFAIGESLVPEFGARARSMAWLFDVPEIGYLGDFQSLRHHVSGSSGVKRSFTFLSHEPGVPHRPRDSCQFATLSYPLGPDSHLYRPEVDAWLTAVAVRYGATYRDRTRVEDVSLDPDGVTLTIRGEPVRARFLCDGSGFRSILADKLALRTDPAAFTTDSRTLFTHMTGVGRIGGIRNGELSARTPSPPDQGTVHHLFDGGWFWVIPFDNHHAAINPACSVGLTLDRRRHPDNDLDAETEFRDFVQRFPTVEQQFRGAKAVREWVKTGRLQYGASRVAGDRWCLLPHSASFVDALFSGGNTLTMAGLQEIARVLLAAFERDPQGGDLNESLFADYQEGSLENVALLDKMVHGAFVCMRSAELFNCWFRVWAVGNFHGAAAITRAHLKYTATGDKSVLETTHDFPCRRVLGTQQPRMRALLDRAYDLVMAFDRGPRDAAAERATVDAMFALLAEQDWVPPQFHIADREHRHLAAFTALPLAGIIRWGRRHAPPDMRKLYYDVGPVFFWELTKTLAREGWHGFTQFARVVMNAHFTRGRA